MKPIVIDPRGTALTLAQRQALADWVKTRKYKFLENLFRKRAVTIRRWKSGKPVTDTIYPELCEALKARLWEADTDPEDGFKPSVSTVIPHEHRQLHWSKPQPAPSSEILYADVDPQAIVSLEIGRASHGRPADAFRALIDHFCIERRLDFSRSMELLPALIYLGYRYGTPSQLVTAIRDVVLPALQLHERRVHSESWLKPLCISQIACALNERGGVAAADLTRELFDRSDVRGLTASDRHCRWPKQQLLRNQAYFWTVHGDSPGRTLELIRAANALGHSVSDRRAAGTLEHALYSRAGKFSKAWEAIEPAYNELRPSLLAAANSKDAHTPQFLNLFSAMFTGSAAKAMARAQYSESEFSDDIFAMNWCIAKYGPIQLVTNSLLPAGSKIPGDLNEFQIRCARLCFDAHQLDVFHKLLRMLDKIF